MICIWSSMPAIMLLIHLFPFQIKTSNRMYVCVREQSVRVGGGVQESNASPLSQSPTETCSNVKAVSPPLKRVGLTVTPPTRLRASLNVAQATCVTPTLQWNPQLEVSKSSFATSFHYNM